MFTYICTEYQGYTFETVGQLRLLPMCILLGAITPYHKIKSLPLGMLRRLASDPRNREILEHVHGWDLANYGVQ